MHHIFRITVGVFITISFCIVSIANAATPSGSIAVNVEGHYTFEGDIDGELTAA